MFLGPNYLLYFLQDPTDLSLSPYDYDAKNTVNAVVYRSEEEEYYNNVLSNCSACERTNLVDMNKEVTECYERMMRSQEKFEKKLSEFCSGAKICSGSVEKVQIFPNSGRKDFCPKDSPVPEEAMENNSPYNEVQLSKYCNTDSSNSESKNNNAIITISPQIPVNEDSQVFNASGTKQCLPSVSKFQGSIRNYVPIDMDSYIPFVISHTLNRIEQLVLQPQYTSLYGNNICQTELNDFKMLIFGEHADKIENKFVEIVGKVENLNLLSALVTSFFSDLSNDPLIPADRFVAVKDAVETESVNKLLQIFRKLEPHRRCTLSFLMLHLQKLVHRRDIQFVDKLANQFTCIVGSNSSAFEHKSRKRAIIVSLILTQGIWQNLLTIC